MKKGLIVVLFLAAMDVWSQSAWIYDRQWSGITAYVGSGTFMFDSQVAITNNDPASRRIVRPSNEQINLIKRGLRQYTVRTNDVYNVLFFNDISNQKYEAFVIITSSTSNGGYDFTYYLWEYFPQRRN
jgi:hypothetical protein